MTKDNSQDFDPYAGLDDDVEEITDHDADSDDYDPFFDDVEPAAPQSPSQSQPQEPEEVIDADGDYFDDDDIDDYEPPIFNDFTPRPTRFTAPTADDVLADDAGVGKTNHKADKEAAKAARRQERKEAKEAKLAAKEEAKRQKRAAVQEAKPPVEVERETPRKKETNRHGLFVAAGIAFLAVAGVGSYMSLSGQNDDQVVAQDSAETVEESSTVDTATNGESAVEEPTFAELASQKCQEAGGTDADGDGSSPEGAIRAYNHAYYVDKSAAETSKYLDDAMYDSVASLQAGIDDKRNGDAYCLKIEKTNEDNRFEVQLIEYMEPNHATDSPETRVTDQVLTMADDDGWKVKSMSIK